MLSVTNSISNPAENVNGEDDILFSFAGENAKTADASKLEEAKRMDREGADSEAIREATGWHKVILSKATRVKLLLKMLSK